MTLSDDLRGFGDALSAWDLKFDSGASGPSRAAASRPLRRGRDAADAVTGADLVISAVTAAQTLAAAEAAARAIRPGAWYLDLNSASPAAKIDAAGVVAGAGGRYVEAAVMSPIAAKRIATPMLLGGPHAQAFLAVARELGFGEASFFSAEPGRAAAAKMCRSVVVKGVEALLTEALLVARCHRVDEAVLRSLDDFFPGADWSELARHMMTRAIQHGVRRAEEMREVARTVSDAGLPPTMSAACAERQEWTSQFTGALPASDLGTLLDAIRVRIGARAERAARR